jgi:hypothetical protein
MFDDNSDRARSLMAGFSCENSDEGDLVCYLRQMMMVMMVRTRQVDKMQLL